MNNKSFEFVMKSIMAIIDETLDQKFDEKIVVKYAAAFGQIRYLCNFGLNVVKNKGAEE